MKKYLIQLISVGILVTLFTGCITQPIKRGTSSHLVTYLYPKGQLISHKNDQMPILKLPLKVGIAFIPESKHDDTFMLSALKKHQLLQQVANKFEADKAILNIQIIPENYLKQGRGFVTLSQIAVLYDVDVMALVSYDQVAYNELNHWSLAYWTIVGAAIIPGESTEFQTFVDTAVFDVTTKKLLFRAPGIHSEHRNHTAIGFEKRNRKLRNEGFEIASRNMAENLSKELDLFKERVKKGKTVKLKYRSGYSSGGSIAYLGIVGLMLLVLFARSRK